jgi:hypothetical protein
MFSTSSSVRGVILVLALAALGAAASAQEPSQELEIDFGDNASPWANDNECDDPRFKGRGMAAGALQDSDRGHDAADCRAALLAGRIVLMENAAAALDPPIPEVASDASVDAVEVPVSAASNVTAPDADAIDFGDDTSVWANDAECDDPRFAGEGVAASPVRANVGRDAADCRAALEDGRAVFQGELEPLWSGVHEDIDFGDNSGAYPGDGECDDPRFVGDNVALAAGRANALKDAHDCRTAFDAGQARFVGELEPAFEGVHDGVDFGDNEGGYPFDGECDDPRFTGDDVAARPSRSNAGHDADDCMRAYDRDAAVYDGELPPLFEGLHDGVDFGDNSGPYVDDAECDDPRFSGEAVAGGARRAHVRADAHDCQEAYAAGTARYDGELPPLFEGVFENVDFGDNEGPYIEDGECDDPRFRGHGMALPPWSVESQKHDAADCHALFEKGFIRLVVEDADNLFEGRADGVDFGDNSGAYVNDGECDDARFEGPGLGAEDGANDRKDAFDCWINLQDGSIILRR